MILVAAPLTVEAFAAFGTVIAATGAGAPVNEGRGRRFPTGADLAHATGAAAPTVALYRLAVSGAPVRVAQFERHPRSAQMFLPLGPFRLLVVVAPDADGAPDLCRARAFVAVAPQGFVYATDVWHAPLFALDRDAVAAMVMWEEGDDGDCVVHDCADPIVVTTEPA